MGNVKKNSVSPWPVSPALAWPTGGDRSPVRVT